MGLEQGVHEAEGQGRFRDGPGQIVEALVPGKGFEGASKTRMVNKMS